VDTFERPRPTGQSERLEHSARLSTAMVRFYE